MWSCHVSSPLGSLSAPRGAAMAAPSGAVSEVLAPWRARACAGYAGREGRGEREGNCRTASAKRGNIRVRAERRDGSERPGVLEDGMGRDELHCAMSWKLTAKDDGGRPGSLSNEEATFSTARRREALIQGAFSLMVFRDALQSRSANAVPLEPSDLSEEAIRAALRNSLTKPKAAGVLRLVFHDAGTYDLLSNSGGMNGSVLYELDRPENGGLKRAVKALEKARLDIGPPSRVSWADLIAVAGAEAVALCGGPSVQVGLGRKDRGAVDPEGRLPSERLSAEALKVAFQAKGLSTQELVALSGAHTLGSKGFGDPVKFDNAYYSALLQRPWEKAAPGDEMTAMIGIPSDHVIASDPECLEWIRLYASDEQAFFEDFAKAYKKMVNFGVV